MLGLGPKSGLVPILQFIFSERILCHMEVCHTQTLQIRAGEGKRLIKAVNNRFNHQMQQLSKFQ